MSGPGAFLLRLVLPVGLGAALVYAATLGLDRYSLTILQFVGINVVLAVSLNVTNGFTGLFSLGHPAFMTIGGYVTAILAMPAARKGAMLRDLPEALAAQEWPFAAALGAGGLVSALAAVVIGIPVLRLRGHYLAVATLGLIFIVQSLAVNLPGITRGALGLSGLPALTNPWWIYLVLVLTLLVCWRVKHGSLGRTMLAIRENELAAACLGVKVARTRVLAFAIGAFFAGIAGGLWAHLVTLISPSSFSILLGFQLIVMVVLGGTGSIVGTAAAAVVLTLATEWLRPVEEAAGLFGTSQIIVAVGVILILIFRPSGLFGTAEPNLFGALARRRRDAVPLNPEP